MYCCKVLGPKAFEHCHLNFFLVHYIHHYAPLLCCACANHGKVTSPDVMKEQTSDLILLPEIMSVPFRLVYWFKKEEVACCRSRTTKMSVQSVRSTASSSPWAAHSRYEILAHYPPPPTSQPPVHVDRMGVFCFSLLFVVVLLFVKVYRSFYSPRCDLLIN
jgi:hypothetical protein